MAQLQLDTLPVEVVRRIAARVPCNDVLNLMQVNHKLRNACNDWTVFQYLIQYNSNGVVNRPDWSPSFLSPQSNADTWAGYALAELKIGEYLQQAEQPMDLPEIYIAHYAPQLVIAHHPTFNLQATKALTKTYYELRHPEFHHPVLDFIIAASTLCPFEERDITHEARIEYYKLLNGYDQASNLEPLTPSRSLWDLWPIPSVRTELHTSKDPSAPVELALSCAYVALPFLYYELKIALAADHFLPPKSATEEELLPVKPVPPTSAMIPFSSFMKEIPLPFSPGCADAIVKSHIPLMTSASFLRSGTWTGYLYENNPLGSHWPRFQYPMSAVQFQHGVDQDTPDEIQFTTTGKMFTSEGAYHWSGNMDCATGKMDMTALFQNDVWNFPLDWQAVMTSFGIVGSMGNERHGHWMWMWKEEWCQQ